MECDDPCFWLIPECYRIKPKPKYKYRPFRTKEECWSEMLKHQPFGWVISKATDDYATIGSINRQISVNITFTTNENDSFTTEFLFEKYKFADGTPFGVRKNNNGNSATE